jgi:amino acid adenylation domain-containing protein
MTRDIDLDLDLLDELGSGDATAGGTIPRRKPNTAIPLSFPQQRLLFLHELGNDEGAYTIGSAFRVSGPLDAPTLLDSVVDLIARHECLRTAIHVRDGVAEQVVCGVEAASIRCDDWSDRGISASDARLRDAARALFRAPFDLEAGAPFRFRLLRLAPREHAILVSLHHIFGDATSIAILFGELIAIYDARCRGCPSPLKPLRVQYGDFAAWQRQVPNEWAEHFDFWRTQLAGLPTLDLPFDAPSSRRPHDHGATVEFRIDAATTSLIDSLAASERTTLFAVLAASLISLLARYSRQDDIAIGSSVSGRNRVETEGMIGFFANMFVLRGTLSADPSLRALTRQQARVTRDAISHAMLPIDRLVEALGAGRDDGRNPLFQVALTLLDEVPVSEVRLGDLAFEPILSQEAARFDLELFIGRERDELAAAFSFNAGLFEQVSIERMASQFAMLLASATRDPELPLSLVDLDPEGWPEPPCAVAPACDSFEPVTERLRAHARLRPAAAALRHCGAELSYGELDARADVVAGRLLSSGIAAGDRVALWFRPGFDMIIAMAAVLRGGATYVPLDPTSSEAHLRVMLEDARPELILTSSDVAAALPDHGTRVLMIDEDAATPCGVSLPATHPDSIAAIIFTAGPAARPKGVCVTAGNLARLFTASKGRFGFGPTDVWTTVHSCAFDASVWEIWGALVHGGTLVIVPEDIRQEEHHLYALLCDERVTVLNQAPAAFRRLMVEEERNGREADLSLRLVILKGQDLELACLQPWIDRHGDESPALFSVYGVTEATIHAACRRIHLADVRRRGSSLIGEPFTGMAIRLVDAHGRPVPPGMVGEITIGGPGVARSYFHQPSLTAAQFFTGAQGEAWCRTGDLARINAKGCLEYRGHVSRPAEKAGLSRQMGEIEAALLASPVVADAAVTVTETGGTGRFAAYAVVRATATAGADPDAIRQYLRDRLPAHMVPSQVQLLDRLPLTANGDLDRGALPAPGQAHRVQAIDDEAMSPTEQTVARVFGEVLGVGAIGRHSDFFELGGHSLGAARVVARLRADLALKLKIRALFDGPTVAALSAAITALAKSEPGAASPEATMPVSERTGPLSFAQQRFWFLDRMAGSNGSLYNVASALRLCGRLDLDAVRKVMEMIVARHASLRTIFPVIDDEPLQHVQDRTDLPLRELTLHEDNHGEDAVSAVARAFAAERFDLAKAPPVRLGLLRVREEETLLLLCLHHIICDGWSLGIIVQEFAEIYRALVEKRTPTLPPLPGTYLAYAIGQRRTLSAERRDMLLHRWTERLAGAPDILALPTDRPRVGPRRHIGATVVGTLGAAQTAALRSLASETGTTLFMVLLAGFAQLLSRHAGQDDLVIGSAIAQRPGREMEGVVGCFLNTLPLRCDVSGDPTARALVARIRTVVLDAFELQDVPFEAIVSALRRPRSLDRSPVFQVMLALQNMPQGELTLPGLSISAFSDTHVAVQFELSLFVQENAADGTLQLIFHYDTDLFDEETIRSLAGQLDKLLAGIAEAPDCPLVETESLKVNQRQQILALSCRDPAVDAGNLVHDMIAERASWIRNRPALIDAQASLTYGEMEAAANRLAHHLQAAGVGAETLVAVALARSVEAVVTVLAVLKAGGAYLPVDLDQPVDRIALIFAEAPPALIVTTEVLRERVPKTSCRMILLNTDGPQIAARPATAAPCAALRGHLAYVMFTSGSTGRPKGVAVSHANLSASTSARLGAYPPLPSMLLVPSLAFDSSIATLFWMLASGGTVHIPDPQSARDPRRLAALVQHQRIAGWLGIPSLYKLALDLSGECLASLQVVVLAGETLAADVVAGHRARMPTTLLTNEYGPTETTVWASMQVVDETVLAGDKVPIGRPIAGTRLLVLDGHGLLVPVGVEGELFIGGTGVARGYVGRPGLTAARFVPDPLIAGERLYRTGDMVRWRRDGRLEFLTRRDGQVKLRGNRIELGEIEVCLASHPAVLQAAACVVDREDGQELLAFIVAAPSGKAFDEETLQAQLRTHAAARLPGPMIPSVFVVIDVLPLNANGKLDRNALPVIDPPQAPAARSAPRTASEATLMRLWENTLKRPVGSMETSFFELGGDSLRAVRLMAQIAREFGQDLPLSAFFTHPGVASLAALIDADQAKSGHPETTPGLSTDDTLVFFPEPEDAGDMTVVMLHEISGLVTATATLATLLGRSYRVIGLQATGRDLADGNLRDVETMAESYARALIDARPCDRFVLVGYSWGAPVAAALARALDQRGGLPLLLVVLDASPGSDATFLAQVPTDQAGLLAYMSHALALSTERDVGITAEVLAPLDPGAQLAVFADRLRATGLVPADFPQARIARMIAVYRANLAADRLLVPGPVPCPVAVWRSAGATHPPGTGPDLGWSPFASHGLVVHRTTGDHLSIVKPPHVQGLADSMLSEIGAAFAGGKRHRSAGPDGRP